MTPILTRPPSGVYLIALSSRLADQNPQGRGVDGDQAWVALRQRIGDRHRLHPRRRPVRPRPPAPPHRPATRSRCTDSAASGSSRASTSNWEQRWVARSTPEMRSCKASARSAGLLAALGDLGMGPDHRKRCAQLMGGVRRKAPLRRQCLIELPHQAVERVGQRLDLSGDVGLVDGQQTLRRTLADVTGETAQGPQAVADREPDQQHRQRQ